MLRVEIKLWTHIYKIWIFFVYRYCTMQCFYQANQCPAQYTKLQHTSISIPRYLPVNTDFLQLRPYIPPGGSESLACYCATYFYPVQHSNHLFGVYQIGQAGIVYNRVVFDEPGFYEFKVVSDFLNGYGSIVSRTSFQVFVDVADYMFWGYADLAFRIMWSTY
jgi:hypothetical protein